MLPMMHIVNDLPYPTRNMRRFVFDDHFAVGEAVDESLEVALEFMLKLGGTRLPLESFIPKVGRSRRDRRRISEGILLLGENLGETTRRGEGD